jgi:hypothetical protein
MEGEVSCPGSRGGSGVLVRHHPVISLESLHPTRGGSLGKAVERVVTSNRKDGYLPTRFIQITEGGYAGDLLERCARVIEKGETLQYLEIALQRFPTLLTLEDFVSRKERFLAPAADDPDE